MASENQSELRAPLVSSKLGESQETNFAAYFLRDLYAKGKISSSVIRDISGQLNLTESDVSGLLEALEKPEGRTVSPEVSGLLTRLAEFLSHRN